MCIPYYPANIVGGGGEIYRRDAGFHSETTQHHVLQSYRSQQITEDCQKSKRKAWLSLSVVSMAKRDNLKYVDKVLATSLLN